MSWLLNPRDADLYIDLGTANTLVVSRENGLIVNEPSVVCYRNLGGDRKAVFAVGNEAKSKIGRTPDSMVTSYPLRDGVIADIDTTEAMLKYFISKGGSTSRFLRPKVVISLPYGVSDIEKQAVRNAGITAGSREVVLIEEPMAAAIGVGLPVSRPTGSMIVDIGGGTTEIAVISFFGIVHCESIRVGGHAFDQAIVSYLRSKYNLIVGESSAEKIKTLIGSAIPMTTPMVAEIRGIDTASGLPRAVTITSNEIYFAIEDLLKAIFDAGRKTLEETPPDLISNILENGAIAVGGGALMQGLAERLTKEFGVNVRIDSDPLIAVARGGEQAIRETLLLEKIAYH